MEENRQILERDFKLKISKEDVQQLLQVIVERFKQELKGENEELLDRIVHSYNSKLARIAWKESQRWCKWGKDGPVLMPNYTRIYYRKGDVEVLLQEFPPQTRLLKFMPSLLKEELQMSTPEGDVNSFSLSLPYVIFIFKFNEGFFQTAQCMFSDRTLKSLDEKPARPYLTNIDPEFRVCLGKNFNYDKLEKGNLNQQITYILDHFWHSIFSNEWHGHFWENKRHFRNTDVRLKSFDAWETATLHDPLFVIDDVNWLKIDDNFGDLLVQNFANMSNVNAEFHEALFHEITTGMLTELKATISNNVSVVEEKFINLDVVKELQKLKE